MGQSESGRSSRYKAACISEFMSRTESSREEAASYLESANWDVENALTKYESDNE